MGWSVIIRMSRDLERKTGQRERRLNRKSTEFHRRMVEGKKNLEKEMEREKIGRKLLGS